MIRRVAARHAGCVTASEAGVPGSRRGGGAGGGGLVSLQLEAGAEGSQHQLDIGWLGIVALQGVGVEVWGWR